jgi:hypothetical protein
VRAGAVALAVALGCGAPRLELASAHEVEPDGDAPALTIDEVRAQLPALQAELEAWRGLRFLEPVEVETESPQREGVAGYYDPATNRLVIDPARKGRFQRGLLLHELQHALQDQHFDLERVAEAAGDTEEARLAVSALVEGEAMLAVIELMDYDFEKVAGIADQAEIDPEETDRFRYGAGSRYVRALRDKCGGWKAVDRAFRKPPRTTEEIQHPSCDGDEPAQQDP